MSKTPRFTRHGATLLTLAVLASACDDTPVTAPHAATPHGAASMHAAQQPVQLDFEKCAIDPGIWEGHVTGDVTGDLRTELRALRESGSIWHVRFDWVITADEQSFVADLTGTLNLITGRVVMNGDVAEGYLAGARVHEQGMLIDEAASCFAGTIRLSPATAHQEGP